MFADIKNMMDVQMEALEHELASRISSDSAVQSTQEPKKSDLPKSTDAGVVKQEAGVNQDASNGPNQAEDGVSSYNRYREAQRKYEKSMEQIEELQRKLDAMASSAKPEVKTSNLTEEKFRELYDQDSSGAILTALKQFSESIRSEVSTLIANDKQDSMAKQTQYMNTLKQFPDLADLSSPFTQAVDAEIKAMQAKGVNYPEMVTHAAEIVYGRNAREGKLPAQKATAADEKARLMKVAQGQVGGKSFGDSSGDGMTGLTEDQINYAKKLGIDPSSKQYRQFIDLNKKYFKGRQGD